MTIEGPDSEAKKERPVPCLLEKTSRTSPSNLMSSGEVVIQSMWSPAVTAVRSKGIQCVFQPLKPRVIAAGRGGLAALSKAS